MNTCKTCKYWASSFKPTGENPIADCDLPNTITGDKLFKQGVGMEINATAHDDSGLEAYLMTGENFGCIHHTEKKSS